MIDKLGKLYDEYLKRKLDLVIKKIGDRHSKPLNIPIGDDVKMSVPHVKSDDNKMYYLENANGDRISDFYDGFYGFSDGYYSVKKENKFNYIDVWGNVLSDEWFTFADGFSCGYGCIKRNGLYNYIDGNGHFLFKNGLKDAKPFKDERALILNDDNRWVYIDTDGNPVNNDSYLEARYYYNGIIIVRDDKGYNFINKDGEQLFEEWFEKVPMISYLCCIVSNGTKENIVDQYGNLVFYDWVDSVKLWTRYSGYKVEKNGKFTFYILNSGRLISNKFYDEVKIDDGYIIAKDNNKYAFINPYNGDVEGNKWYEFIEKLKNFCIVKDNGKYNIFNSYYQPMSNEWYSDIDLTCFDSLLKVTRSDGKMGFIDKDNNLLNKKWYDYADGFRWFVSIVGINEHGIMKWNCLDKNGNEMLWNWSLIKPKRSGMGNSTVILKVGLKEITRSLEPRDFGDYEVKKVSRGYSCTSSKDSFTVDYEPIHIYGSRYIVCHDRRKIYMYDRKDNFLEAMYDYDEENIDYFKKDMFFYKDGIFLVYNDELYDITDYYSEANLDCYDFTVVEGYKILTEELFFKEVCDYLDAYKLDFDHAEEACKHL